MIPDASSTIGTATLFEYIFFVSAVASSVMALWTMGIAWRADAYVQASGTNGLSRLISSNMMRGETFRFVKAAILTLCAWATLFLPPPPPMYGLLPQSVVILISLILVNLVMITHSVLEVLHTRRVEHYTATRPSRRAGDVPNPEVSHDPV